MPIMTTAIYAAFNATFSIILAVMVSAKRAKTNVFLGTGSPELFLAMRRHGHQCVSRQPGAALASFRGE